VSEPQTPDFANIHNPFTASRLRPGAVPYFFPAGQTIADLIERLQRTSWWGQILGPHGAGKSSLVAALTPAIQQAGRATLAVALHDGQRRLPADFRQAVCQGRPDILIIDGYEQLSVWSRFRLKRYCRRRGLGLIVTAHRSVGLPDLARVAVELPLAWQVVEHLQQDCLSLVRCNDVEECLLRHEGNLREVLFDLYDLYQERFSQPFPGRSGTGPFFG
jgi:hypothetical protein